MKYILLYTINEVYDRIEYLEDVDQLDKRIDEIIESGYELITAGELKEHKKVLEVKTIHE